MILQKSKSYYIGFVLLSVLLTSCLSRPERYSSQHRAPSHRPSASESANSTTLLTNYAQLLGVASSELENSKLYAFIDEWMGVPHRLGGQTKVGIDCSAFINQLFNEVYERPLARSSYEMADGVKRKYENQLIEGDLVFFSFGKKNIDHVGLYLKNNKFVHVSTSKGVIISDLHESWFYKYFVRAGSVK
jgi:lipoprotein Spr